MTVAEIFKVVGLSPHGPVPWNAKISEPNAGVYVIGLVDNADLGCEVCADYLPTTERQLWLPNEPIVYIGATEREGGLAVRIGEFYRHKYGEPAPHSGGQAVKLLKCDLWVYWSPIPEAFDCEDKMLAAFEERVGQFPFANRR